MSEYNGVPVRKTVGAILVNERGEVLLQQRDEKQQQKQPLILRKVFF